MLVAFGAVSINWSTGDLHFRLLHVTLLGAALEHSIGGYGPWFVTISLPIVAIIFLIRRRSLLEAAQIARYAAQQHADE